MNFFIMLSLVALVSLPVIAQDEPAADEQTIEVSQETEEVSPAASEDVPPPTPPPPVAAETEAPKKEKVKKTDINNVHADAIKAKLEESGLSTEGLHISSSIGQGLMNYAGGIGNSIIASKSAVQKYTVTTKLANGKKFVCKDVSVKTEKANITAIQNISIAGCAL